MSPEPAHELLYLLTASSIASGVSCVATAGSVHLEPQVFDVLVHLVRNRDRVVTKDELQQAVWNGRVVSEDALTSRISSARRAIGDTGEDQRLIRTVQRRGFRFVGDVRETAAWVRGRAKQPTPQLPKGLRGRP